MNMRVLDEFQENYYYEFINNIDKSINSLLWNLDLLGICLTSVILLNISMQRFENLFWYFCG